MQLEKARQKMADKGAMLQEKDIKMEDMKAIIKSLTANNNEMLTILSTKVRLGQYNVAARKFV